MIKTAVSCFLIFCFPAHGHHHHKHRASHAHHANHHHHAHHARIIEKKIVINKTIIQREEPKGDIPLNQPVPWQQNGKN